MAVSIRLRRMGRKKQPHYRVVVADRLSPRDGRFIESVGYYKPLTHPARLVLDLERVDYWLDVGAEPSNTVRGLIKRARRGGDRTVTVGEPDHAAEKAERAEALASQRRAEAAAAAAEEAQEEAAGAEGKAAPASGA